MDVQKPPLDTGRVMGHPAALLMRLPWNRNDDPPTRLRSVTACVLSSKTAQEVSSHYGHYAHCAHPSLTRSRLLCINSLLLCHNMLHLSVVRAISAALHPHTRVEVFSRRHHIMACMEASKHQIHVRLSALFILCNSGTNASCCCECCPHGLRSHPAHQPHVPMLPSTHQI